MAETAPEREQRAGADRDRRGTRAFGFVYLALVLVFLGAMARFYRPGEGLTSMIRFGERYTSVVIPELRAMPKHVVPGAGYDGEFYAQFAAHPAPWSPEVQRAMDNPWYRAGRILPSVLAYALAFGNPVWAVHVYAAQFLLVWLLVAFLLARWFPPGTPWDLACWAGCLFSAGMLMAVTRALPDAWSFLLVAAGLYFWENRRSRVGVVLLGLAGLARETVVLAAAALLEGFPRITRQVAGNVVVALAPALLWAVILRLCGGHINSMARVFSLPFAGLWDRLETMTHVHFWRSLHVVLTMFALVCQAAFFVFRRRPSDWRWRLGIAHVVLMAFLGPAVWEGYPGAAVRVLLPMLLAFNLSVPRGPRAWPLLIAGNLSVVSGVLMLARPPG